jgi:alpha-glucosidase/alpha-D-xyloside xylohydrolase
MPYLYSAVKESCETGLPIVRSLWFHDPHDPAAVSQSIEDLYGRDILVAPVLDKGAVTRLLYLPRGVWYDFWTGEKLQGGRSIERPVDLETIPLYVRAGALIPMGPVRQYTAEKVEGPLVLWVHPGANGSFSLYEDDGETFDYRKGEFMRMSLVWNDRQRRLTLRLASGSKMLPPAKRNLVVRVAGEAVSREVVFDGRPLQVQL